ncbi:MAG TPA: ParA family protein [Methanoculleus sp.]|nr:ParA family protein [Methanoculleus sp.]
MSIIAFAHHKGGTGKTTSCLNIAGFLHLDGDRVLVVDSDPQANATAGLGVDPFAQQPNMYDVYMSFFEGFPDIFFDDVIIETQSGISLAPSSLDLVGVEPYLYNIDERAGILKEALQPVKDAYDHILIDTPPSMGQFVINGLVAADKTIVTLDSGIFALKGIEALATIFDDIEEHVGGTIAADMAILTRWGNGSRPATPIDEIASLIKRMLYGKTAEGDGASEAERLDAFEHEVKQLFPSVYAVPFDGSVYEAQRHGMPLSAYAPESAAARTYREITQAIRNW